jgi:4-carboxymuconolactone decarboxylase
LGFVNRPVEGALRPFFVMMQKRSKRVRRTPLTARLRVCSAIAALYAVGKREEASRIVREGLQRLKLPGPMFSELFLHLSLFLGFPAMIDGFETLLAMKPSPKFSTRARSRRASVRRGGLAILKQIYGSQTRRLLRRLDELHPELPERIIDDAYGRIVARQGLSLREREVVNVVVLALGGYHRQLYSHIRGAIRVGVQAATLASVLVRAERRTGRNLGSARALVRDLASQRPMQTGTGAARP